jgi:hypothetical protein
MDEKENGRPKGGCPDGSHNISSVMILPQVHLRNVFQVPQGGNMAPIPNFFEDSAISKTQGAGAMRPSPFSL